MRGKCAFSDCFVLLSVAECSSCAKPVHHMCSNAVCEGELTLRVCSSSCANALGLSTPPPRSATAAKPCSSAAKGAEAAAKRATKTNTRKATTKRKAKTSSKLKSNAKPKSSSVKKSKVSVQTGEQDTNGAGRTSKTKPQSRRELSADQHGVVAAPSDHDQSAENAGLDNCKRRKSTLSDNDKSNAATRDKKAGVNAATHDNPGNLREGGTEAVNGGSHPHGNEDDESSESNGSDPGSSDDEAPRKKRNGKPKKFFFTPAADLALLREMLDIQPYAANHGSKTTRYQEVTDHLNEHLETELGIRTVKEHFFLLVKEFKATDCEYRKKSGVSEEYTEHKRLLQNITEEMRDLDTKKKRKKKAAQDKSDRLESAGAKLREQAVKRRCQRDQARNNDDEASDASNESSLDSSQNGGEPETTSSPSKTTGKPAGVTTAQVNTATVSFIEGQRKRHDDEFELLREELRFKRVKAEKEEARWKVEMEFRQQEADRKAERSSEDAELRRAELQLRREELAVLKHQLGIQRLPNGADQSFV